MSEEAGKKYLAELVRGNVYYLNELRFDKGIKIVVSESIREHLDQHALDVTGDGESVFEHEKFRFVDYDGPKAVGQVIGEKPVEEDERLDRQNRKRIPASEERVRRDPTAPARTRSRG